MGNTANILEARAYEFNPYSANFIDLELLCISGYFNHNKKAYIEAITSAIRYNSLDIIELLSIIDIIDYR